MRLAQEDDAAENLWIFTTALTLFPFGDRFADSNLWLAGTDRDLEGQWRWHRSFLFWQGEHDGSAVTGTYSTWATREPNDANSGEDCLAKVMRATDPQGWNDQRCENRLWYVCEDY